MGSRTKSLQIFGCPQKKLLATLITFQFVYRPMSKQLNPGDAAPFFETLAIGGAYGEGTPVSSTSLKNKTAVLYFYPKDDTPGCTKQACGLRDAWTQFASLDAQIFGVSADGEKSHRKFIDKFSLPFPLLVDTDHKISENFGVWVEKSMYGKKYMGIERSTFVIGPDGRIRNIFRKVKPEEHANILLAELTKH